MSRSVSLRQVCQNHFAQCPLRGGLQEPARSTGHSQFADASLSHLLARRPARVRRGDATVVRVLDVGFASGLLRSLPSVCRPLKRPRVDTDLHSSPSGWTRPNICGMMDAPCNGCWKAPPPSGWGRNKAIRPTGRLPYRGWRLPPTAAFPSTAAFARTADPCVATVAPQLGWDPWAPTHAFPSVFAHPFSPTFESRRVTTSDRVVDARSTTTVSKPIHPSRDPYQYHHHRL